MEKLSLILWRERELLELLAYKLELEQLVLTSGRTRWLAHSTREVEGVLAELRETEVLRAVAAEEVGLVLGIGPSPSLNLLAASAEEPWATIFADHRQAFVSITGEIRELSEANKGMLTAGYRSARETLMSIGGTADGYSFNGTAVVDAPRRRLLDRTL